MCIIDSPKEYGQELVQSIGRFYTLGMPEDTKAVTEEKISPEVFLQQVKQIQEERQKMFFYELKRFSDGAYAFVFDEGDRLKHIFWKNRVLEQSDGFEVAKEIEDYYVGKDRFIGDVLSRIDSSTRLMVISDHGFNSFERQVNINTWLLKEGYLKAKPGADMGASLFQYVDWENTKAYSLGFTSIYLNIEGREAKGCVKPEDAESLTDEIAEKLGNIEDEAHKARKVMTKVYKSREVYSGEHTKLAPELVVGFSPGYRMSWKNAEGSLNDKVISDNDSRWKGDHLIDRSHVPGVIFSNFRIKKENPELIDICLLYTSPSPRDRTRSRMPSSA